MNPEPKLERIEAPFSPPTVEALNRWQACDWTHPFTCPDRNSPAHWAYARAYRQTECGSLVASRLGWTCPACGYRQTWAHEFMLKLPARPPWKTGGEE